MSEFDREASHAGAWYPKNKIDLKNELKDYFSNIEINEQTHKTKAIICPHAGYTFCGQTAAYSWANLKTEGISTIFILGPSHFLPISKCALPFNKTTKFKTPLGDLQLDLSILQKLKETKNFDELTLEDDEEEHSIELQLPFLKHTFEGCDISIVPIVVGNLSDKLINFYSNLLEPYFSAPDTLFVISSDFCHWGMRFRYTYIDPDYTNLPIYQSIKKLDLEAIEIIEKHDSEGLKEYFRKCHNTICGRYSIFILLHMIEKSPKHTFSTKLLDYSQSSKITSKAKSSVSYAAIRTIYTQNL